MNTKEDFISRVGGSLWGLIVGDSLGMPLEFTTEQLAKENPVTDLRGGGPFRLNAGDWTDDSAMALATLRAYVDHGWNINKQMNAWCEWYLLGKHSCNGKCFDIGSSTRQALDIFLACGDWKKCGSMSAGGNGALMRLSAALVAATAHVCESIPMAVEGEPCAIERWRHEIVTHVVNSSKATHRMPENVSGCRVFANLLIDAWLCGPLVKEILSDSWILRYYSLKSREYRVWSQALRTAITTTPSNGGYWFDTLSSALHSYLKFDTYEEIVLDAVNRGGDADTVGAVAGQLAGATYGTNGIPPRFFVGLSKYEEISELIAAFV